MPTVFTFDDHELVNDIRGCGTIGFRERRAVFRDIGIRAWEDYAGWANPYATTQDIHFGTATLKKGSDILVDEQAPTSRSSISQQAANLHVHWGTITAGEDDIRLDNEPPGNPNAGVFGIAEVLDAHRLRITPAAYADSTGSYSIGRRSYGKFTVSNCDYFILDCKTHREMHDPKNPARPGLTILGRGAEGVAARRDAPQRGRLLLRRVVGQFHDPAQRRGRPRVHRRQGRGLDGAARRARGVDRGLRRAEEARLHPHRRPAQQLRDQDHRPRVGVRLRPAELGQPRPARRRRQPPRDRPLQIAARARATSAGRATSCPTSSARSGCIRITAWCR